MVQLNAIRDANSKLVNSQPLIAVFVGGTSGIGEFTLRALVSTHSAKGNGLCIYIVGRNAQSAKTIISDCTAKCPDGKYHFIQAKDLSLMQNIDKAAAEITQHLQQNSSSSYPPRIDILFMSQGGLYLGPRQGTLILLRFSHHSFFPSLTHQNRRHTRRPRLRHVNALLLPCALYLSTTSLAAIIHPASARGIGLCSRFRSKADLR